MTRSLQACWVNTNKIRKRFSALVTIKVNPYLISDEKAHVETLSLSKVVMTFS